ncbi:MAG: PEGA domain-containing protein [Spirochaetales bacterium]|nr:PEGA domain-containing protein [Spirochaetales bacterium]
MKRAGLFVVSVISFLLVTACDSIPVPSKEAGSLLVVARTSGIQPEENTNEHTVLLQGDSFLTFSGPLEFSLPLASKQWSCALKKLPPGEYTLRLNAGTLPGSIERIVIPQQSVFLFPYYFIYTHENILYIRPVGAEEQKKAINSLSGYVGLEKWFGHEWTGFGAFQPELILSGRKYIITIESEPGEADIYIDDEYRGKTNQTLELSEGKYLLTLTKTGFRPYRIMVTVNKETTIKGELIKIAETESSLENKDRFSILVLPFHNLGDEADNLYSDVLKDAFELNFSLSASLEVLTPDTGSLTPSDTENMDFTLANQYGAELVLAGKYYVKGKRLFTHICLYDVKSERIKLAEIYESSTGLTILTAIDEMSVSFLDAVTKVLPDTGESIIEEVKIPEDKILEYEKELYRKKLISRRLENRNIMTLSGGIGGTWDTITINDREKARLFDGGPPLCLRFKYEYLFTTYFSLGAAFVPVFGNIRLEDKYINVMDLSLFLGPNFLLNSVITDIYISPLLGFTFSPGINPDMEITPETIGPFFLMGLNIESGLRFYPAWKIEGIPLFFTTFFSMDLFQYRFGGGYDPEPVNIQFLIHIGAGIGL